MAGHAELIIGFGIFPSDMIFLVASDTSSAALETSKHHQIPNVLKLLISNLYDLNGETAHIKPVQAVQCYM